MQAVKQAEHGGDLTMNKDAPPITQTMIYL